MRTLAPLMPIVLAGGLMTCCSSPPRYPVSDHFDGSRFFNPGNEGTHGAMDIVKLLATIRFEAWPDRVENQKSERADVATPENLNSGEVAVTFIGHASALIETTAITVITDPVWSEQVGPTRWLGPTRVRDPGIAFEELPHIDLVIISHNHYDHLDLATLKRLHARFSPTFLVPLGDARLFTNAGITDVREMDWWEVHAIAEAKVTFTPNQHGSARGLFDRNKSLWGGYMIETGSTRVYFGGDAAYSSAYREIRERLGAPDVALLPIGAYEPRWFMKSVHMNPADAVRAHLDLEAGHSVGIHHGTFQQTEEAIAAPPRALEEALKYAGLDAGDFSVPVTGSRRIHGGSATARHVADLCTLQAPASP